MNCSEIQRICLENGGRNLPAECAEHLVGCAECRKVNERTSVISKLLSLKKHEHPDPHFEIRNAAAIRKRISEEKQSAFGWLTGSYRPWHGWAVGAAAACAALAVVLSAQSTAHWFNSPQGFGSGGGVAAVEKPTAQSVPVIVAPNVKLDPNDPALYKPMVVIQDRNNASSRPPAGSAQTQFGNSNILSKPVQFVSPGPLPRQE